MIIGLVGLKGSGKDTVAAYLVKTHQFERRAFADKLKESFSALTGIPVWEIENYKNDPGVFLGVGYETSNPTISGKIGDIVPPMPDRTWSPISQVTFREALQLYGTESHRDVFGEDFWLDQCMPVEGFYAGRAIVVSDVRFENEIQRIHTLGGKFVVVERAGGEQDPHRSENEWYTVPADYVLKNNGTIEELYAAIEIMLGELVEDEGI